MWRLRKNKMKKAILILGAIYFSLILTSCNGNREYEKEQIKADDSYEEPANNREPTQSETNQTNTQQVYVWGCKYCTAVKYQFERPDVTGCILQEGNGTISSTHSWNNYGESGNNSFLCQFCGLRISVSSNSPSDDGCISHDTGGGGIGSWHKWQ